MFESQVSPLYLLGSISLGIIVPSLFGIYALFYKAPHHVVRLGFRYQMYKCNMRKKFVQRGNQVFCYGEKNSPKPDQPTLVFLHGFTSSKLQWLSTFRLLRKDCHMIAMDMPGHGDSSTPDENEPINLNTMDAKFCLFLELVGLSNKKIHVVGSSLGGALAGIFAALHPDKVAKVTMICPAMNPPVESEFIQVLKKNMTKNLSDITYDDCIFFPQDVKGIKEMFELCIYRKEFVNLHPQIFKGMLTIRSAKYPYFLRMYKATNTEEYLNMLASLAPSITMPSQIIWGKEDEIINSSGAAYLKERLPDCRHMDVLENCGHAVDVDRPGSLCKALENLMNEK